jgi:hypothetical protein
LALKEPNFWVNGPDHEVWIPVDAIEELLSESPPSETDAGKEKRAHVLERCIDELIGLCKGIIADGRVEQNEAEFLKSWLENNREVAGVWPANVLNERINKIFADGVIDEGEQVDLAHLLARFTGVVPGVSDAEQLATRLPVDDPVPDVDFTGKSFCLTGKFVFGSRQNCEQVILAKGGACQPRPDGDTDYLVIGALGNHEWSHSPYGEKVEWVLNNREQGAKAAIIAEEHWTFFLNPEKFAASPG